MMAFLRLIRYPNLLFIVLTQVGLHYLIVLPIMKDANMISVLSHFDFALLVFSTVLIAAAGYIINDYFDVPIDRINKPQSIYIDTSLTRRAAILLHQGFSGAAILIGLYLAWRVGNLKLAFLQPIVVAFLWFYSTSYKKQPLIGNVIVSLLTGLVVLIVALYQTPLFYHEDFGSRSAAFAIFIRLFFYFVFAFLVSLMREMVKDMEDMYGDERYGLRTLPIVIGVNSTKWIVGAIGWLVLMLVGFIQWSRYIAGDFLTIIYLLQTIQVPLGVILWQLIGADAPSHFRRVSTLIKLLMLMGIFSMLYLYYLYAF